MSSSPIRVTTFLTLAALVLVPEVALAHTAGALDVHGCHSDRRRGGYHCHTGEYANLEFRSKAEMLEKRKSGIGGDELRADAEAARRAAGETDGGWLSWIPFVGGSKDDEEEPAEGVESAPGEETARESDDDGGSSPRVVSRGAEEFPATAPQGASIVPDGLEERLQVLQRLHDKGLITDSEYAEKKAEILEDL